jgi:hypothetical protein
MIRITQSPVGDGETIGSLNSEHPLNRKYSLVLGESRPGSTESTNAV